MATFCSESDVLLRAGNNATTALSTTEVENFIEQAEGAIISAARYDFVSEWSNLVDNAKNILKEAASCLAANAVIAYDMTGYNQRIMAEDLININRDTALRDISILRDSKVKTFIKGEA